jgi:hypothetical protein
MFSFFSHKKVADVQRLLTSRINHSCLSNLDPKARNASRSSFCEVVWLVFVGENRQPDFTTGIPVVSKDICAQGLALIHTHPVEDERVLVGLQSSTGPGFLNCSVEHCTSLGYGFYQVGLRPEEVTSVSSADLATLEERLEQLTGQNEAVTV